jgi:hypothetical protein
MISSPYQNLFFLYLLDHKNKMKINTLNSSSSQKTKYSIHKITTLYKSGYFVFKRKYEFVLSPLGDLFNLT